MKLTIDITTLVNLVKESFSFFPCVNLNIVNVSMVSCVFSRYFSFFGFDFCLSGFGEGRHLSNVLKILRRVYLAIVKEEVDMLILFFPLQSDRVLCSQLSHNNYTFL